MIRCRVCDREHDPSVAVCDCGADLAVDGALITVAAGATTEAIGVKLSNYTGTPALISLRDMTATVTSDTPSTVGVGLSATGAAAFELVGNRLEVTGANDAQGIVLGSSCATSRCDLIDNDVLVDGGVGSAIGVDIASSTPTILRTIWSRKALAQTSNTTSSPTRKIST